MRRLLILILLLLLTSCAPATSPSSSVQVPEGEALSSPVTSGFAMADGSRPLSFPQDFGAHEDFRTEWWYYTGNLQTPEGRHFGFELTIFRVGLLPPTVELPIHFKVVRPQRVLCPFCRQRYRSEQFYAFERYSRPGPGLAGAQADPYQRLARGLEYHASSHPAFIRLQAAQDGNSASI